MNSDLNVLIRFASQSVSRIHTAFNRLGLNGEGKDCLSDHEFQAMLKERVDFLCADTPISVDIRKAALEYQTDQVVSVIERLSNPQVSSKWMPMLEKIGGANFIPMCEHRAQLLDNVFQTTLTTQISASTQSKGRV